MTLVTTIGSSSANSYSSVAEADAALAASIFYPDVSLWTALTTAQKEELLIHATLVMGRFWWNGYEVYENQALPLPRRWTEDEDIVIPDNAKTAQAYIAFDVILRSTYDKTLPSEGGDDMAVKSFSVGGLSVTLASQSLQQLDATALAQAIKSQYAHIYRLIESLVSEVGFIPGPGVRTRRWSNRTVCDEWGISYSPPALLDEVA